MDQPVQLLRQEESKLVMDSVDDLAVSQLMNLAHYQVVKWYVTGEKYIAADFDICFFMEVMKEVFSDKQTIKRILNGEDLRWFTNDMDIS
jgi:hypothetical protein